MLSANEYKALLRKYMARVVALHGNAGLDPYMPTGVRFAPHEMGELEQLEDELDAFPAGRDTDSALLPVLDRS